MVHCVVSSRQVDESCTDDHASLVTVFNVSGLVQQLAGALLPGPEGVVQLLALFCLESFVRKVCTYGIRGRLVCSSSESLSLSLA